MVEREAKVSTRNTPLSTDDAPFKIEETITITVPESIEEAAEFYGGEGKLLDVLQAETQRRKVNAARAVLREIDNENTDFNAFATQIAEGYTPGRKGGFTRPVADSDALAAASGSMEDLEAYLASLGVTVA